jgi:hypothetical protein
MPCLSNLYLLMYSIVGTTLEWILAYNSQSMTKYGQDQRVTSQFECIFRLEISGYTLKYQFVVVSLHDLNSFIHLSIFFAVFKVQYNPVSLLHI